MADARKLESTVEGWYKKANVPHLPKNGQKWLAENVWWLALLGAVLSVLGLFVVVPLFFAAIAITSIATSATFGYSMVATGYAGLFWLSALISIASYVVTTVLLIMSISPLKVKAKKGWQLLFWSYLLNFGLAVVSDLVVVNIFGIIGAAIGAAIAGYFLFEIRDFFGAKHKVEKHHKAEAK